MGQAESSDDGLATIYQPLNGSRLMNEDDFQIAPESGGVRHVLNTAFSGIWSINHPDCISPPARCGHFTFEDKEKQRVYIGYGQTVDSKPLTDIWVMDIPTQTWSEIKISNPFSPRNGSRAVGFRNTLIVFGGFYKDKYFNDIFVINLDTKGCIELQTNGERPEPRSTPIIGVWKESLYIWGGFNSGWPNSLSVLDLRSLNWSHYPQEIHGRTSIPYVQIEEKIYAYGCSKTNGLIEINMETRTVSEIKTTGAPPPSETMSGTMVKMEQYLLYFGGKKDSQTMLVYALDLTRMWWFVFFITPDNNTISLCDGTVSESGLFLLPRLHSVSAVYDHQKKEVIAFLGSPMADPIPHNVLRVGEAFGFLNLRDDMLDALSKQ